MNPLINKEDKWIDVSVKIRNTMTCWPGDPRVEIKRIQDIDCGNSCNLSTIKMTLHTGTHIDAPLHFLKEGKSIENLSFDTIMGMVKIIEIFDKESIKVDELRGHKLRKGDRIFFKTKNSKTKIPLYNKTFLDNYVFLSEEAAEYLVSIQIRIVGIDYLSIGAFNKHGDKTHETLLVSGIWIIEGLDLSKVEAGKYQLICLPLNIEGVEGAPARVLIKRHY